MTNGSNIKRNVQPLQFLNRYYGFSVFMGDI